MPSSTHPSDCLYALDAPDVSLKELAWRLLVSEDVVLRTHNKGDVPGAYTAAGRGRGGKVTRVSAPVAAALAPHAVAAPHGVRDAARRADVAMHVIARALPAIFDSDNTDDAVEAVRHIRTLETLFEWNARAATTLCYLYLACGPVALRRGEDLEPRELMHVRARASTTRGFFWDAVVVSQYRVLFGSLMLMWAEAERETEERRRCGKPPSARIDLIRLIENLSRVRAWRLGVSPWGNERDAYRKARHVGPVPPERQPIAPEQWIAENRRKVREHTRAPTELLTRNGLSGLDEIAPESERDGNRRAPRRGTTDDQFDTPEQRRVTGGAWWRPDDVKLGRVTACETIVQLEARADAEDNPDMAFDAVLRLAILRASLATGRARTVREIMTFDGVASHDIGVPAPRLTAERLSIPAFTK